MKNTLRIFAVLLILASCQAKKTKDKTLITNNTDKNLIKVPRVNPQQGWIDTVTVDKIDYRIIQHLDTLDNRSYSAYFRVNEKGRIHYIKINTRFDYKLPQKIKMQKWKQFKATIFESEKTSLSNLPELDVVILHLSNFDFIQSITLPHLKSLRALTVTTGSLQSLHLHPQNNISLLRLNQNNILSIDSVLAEANKIQDLIIAANKISQIKIDTNRFKNLKVIELAGNPIVPYLDSVRKRYPNIRFFPEKKEEENYIG